MSRNLTLRILSALVLAPLAIGAVYLGGWVFKAFVLILFIGSCLEWQAMCKNFTPRPLYLVFGVLYFAVSLFLLSQLRDSDNGFYLTVTLLLVVWASDTVAYIFGRSIGGPKMAPKISPNKTWAGLLGSITGAGGIFYAMIDFGPELSTYIANAVVDRQSILFFIVAGIILGITGQAGDLLESYMKRKAGMKDSGNLIPGHGGVLDRIDALLLVTPVFYLLCTYGL